MPIKSPGEPDDSISKSVMTINEFIADTEVAIYEYITDTVLHSVKSTTKAWI